MFTEPKSPSREEQALAELGWHCSSTRSDSNEVARWTLTAERGRVTLMCDVWVSYMELRAAALNVAGHKQQQGWRDILARAESMRTPGQ